MNYKKKTQKCQRNQKKIKNINANIEFEREGKSIFIPICMFNLFDSVPDNNLRYGS